MDKTTLINDVCVELTEDPGGNDPIEIVKELLHSLNEIECYKHDKIIMWFGHSWLNELEDCGHDPQELIDILVKSLKG